MRILALTHHDGGKQMLVTGCREGIYHYYWPITSPTRDGSTPEAMADNTARKSMPVIMAKCYLCNAAVTLVNTHLQSRKIS